MLDRYYPEDVARVLLSQLMARCQDCFYGDAVITSEERGCIETIQGVAAAFGFEVGDSLNDLTDELRRRSRTFAT